MLAISGLFDTIYNQPMQAGFFISCHNYLSYHPACSTRTVHTCRPCLRLCSVTVSSPSSPARALSLTGSPPPIDATTVLPTFPHDINLNHLTTLPFAFLRVVVSLNADVECCFAPGYISATREDGLHRSLLNHLPL